MRPDDQKTEGNSPLAATVRHCRQGHDEPSSHPARRCRREDLVASCGRAPTPIGIRQWGSPPRSYDVARGYVLHTAQAAQSASPEEPTMGIS